MILKILFKDIALQIAASMPKYLRQEDISQDVLDKELDFLNQQALEEGIAEDKIQVVVLNRLEKNKAEMCLLSQTYNKDPNMTINDLLQSNIAKLGENITIF